MVERGNCFFSIVIGFRNREIWRVKNVLESLLKQTFTNFELIFIDYGSDIEIAEQAKKIISSYAFAKYFYSDTRGFFWNRAHALNTGIKLAESDKIIISDIDLIFPNNYLESVSKLSFSNTFYTFSCYYLPEKANYTNVTAVDIKNSSINYVGLCAVSKKDLFNNNYFDEYYMVWGGEDDDLYLRLNNSGCLKQHLKVDAFPVLHQWHSKHSPSHPTYWYLDMVNYLYSRKYDIKFQNNENGLLIERSKRTILNRMEDSNNFKVLELFGNPLFQFNLFLDDFFKMKTGEFGQFAFPMQLPLPKGRKQKLVEKLNKGLSKYKFPYLLEKKKELVPIHSREICFDFIQYFVGKNRSYLHDYFLIDTEKELKLLFQKK